MKKIRAVAALMITVLMCGCSDATELGNRAIIQAAAVDYDKGEYTVSALMFSSGGSGGDTIDASQENVIKVVGTGKTLGEAINDVSLTDGKELYMSETKLLILGGGFENGDVISVLNTLYHDYRCSLNMPICCSEKAETLTDMHFKEGITAAEKPVSMIETAYNNGVSPKTTLLDALSDNAAGRKTLIPMFKEEKNGYGMTTDENGKTAVLCGGRFISEGKLTDIADTVETAGFMILYGEAKKIPLNLNYNGVEYVCEAYNIKAKPAPAKGRGASLSVSVKAGIRLKNGEAISGELNEMALGQLEQLAQTALDSGKDDFSGRS